MLFSSIVFLFIFLPLVLGLYFLFSFSRILQNILLLVASLFFYAWGEPVNVFIMIASILLNSAIAYLIEYSKTKKIRKFYLILAIGINLSLLFVFKYLGFTMELIGMDRINIALPIGISFFTFQAMSYVIDVYNKKVKAENPFYVGLYISFFPQLVAGPIIQYNTIAKQIRERKTSFDMLSMGISRFAAGLIKKVLLANSFAEIANVVFNLSTIGTERYVVPAMLAWIGSIAYTLQIYYDFSAYSDMAIGLGLCFGFKFPENFNYPYIATSISDFWKRWHISLTNWFREYVYIPLGGNRVQNKDKMVRNMFIVWLLTGIWHGANWTFIFWGLSYFIIQLAERFFEYPKKMESPLLKHLYTLIIVNILWVIFRADNLYQAGRFLMNMFAVNNNGIYSDLAIFLIKDYAIFWILGILFTMPIARKANEYFYNNPQSKYTKIASVFYPIVMFALVLMCVMYLVSGSYNPFIYFNF